MSSVNEFIAQNAHLSDREVAEQLQRQGVSISRDAVRLRRVRTLGITKDLFGRLLKENNLDPKTVSSGWVKPNQYLSAFVYNPEFERSQVEDVAERMIEKMQKYSPKYPTIKRVKIKDGHLAVINITDIHIGENTALVIKRCHAAIDDVLSKASMFPISQILFIGGNDILHFDSEDKRTTKGTYVGGDTTSEDMYIKAEELYVALIEKLIPIAPVHYIHIPDNHAKKSAFGLTRTIHAYFHKNKEVTFDITPDYRKRYVFGENLICAAHGHGVRDNERPLDFATVFAKEWGQTSHRYGYLGHIHHNKSIISKHIKEMPGIEIQWLRTLQPQNDYESLNGYHSLSGISIFIHHPTEGQVARFNKNF